MVKSTPSVINYIRGLEHSADLDRSHLETAAAWAKKRRVYIHHTFEECAAKKYFGVFDDFSLLSVISIEVTGEGEYLFHVTSAPKSDLELIANAVYQIGWSLFDRLKAEIIYTHRPAINGHEHRGSTAMCEMTGLHPYGLPEEEEINGVRYEWQVYQMTRFDWLIDHQKREAA